MTFSVKSNALLMFFQLIEYDSRIGSHLLHHSLLSIDHLFYTFSVAFRRMGKAEFLHEACYLVLVMPLNDPKNIIFW